MLRVRGARMGKERIEKRRHDHRHLRHMQRHGGGKEMSLRRDRKSGEYVFSCNNPDCGAVFRVKAGTKASAWKAAKAVGWVAGRVGVAFLHWCSWVHRPHRDERIPQAQIDDALDAGRDGHVGPG